MNAYPIGNDLTVKWSLLYSDGSVFPLSNYDYELSYRTNRGNKVVTDTSVISVDENILTWTFKGDEQVVSGRYTICLKITLSGSKVVELQYDNAFMLSPLSGFKGAGSEIVLQSYCDAIDLKDAVLQARKAMDIAANALVDTANSARDAKAAKAAAEVTAAQAKADAESAKTMAADAKDKVAVAEKAATDASRDAVAAQQAAQTASDHITSLQQAIAELPDGQAVTEKVAEHTIKLTELQGQLVKKITINPVSLMQQNGFIEKGNGRFAQSQLFNATDYVDISVLAGKKCKIKSTIYGYSALAFYSERSENNYISDFSTDNIAELGYETTVQEPIERELDVPSNAKYARMSVFAEYYTGLDDLYFKGINSIFDDITNLKDNVEQHSEQINALNGNISEISTKIGNLEDLQTSNKENIVSAINTLVGGDVFSYVDGTMSGEYNHILILTDAKIYSRVRVSIISLSETPEQIELYGENDGKKELIEDFPDFSGIEVYLAKNYEKIYVIITYTPPKSFTYKIGYSISEENHILTGKKVLVIGDSISTDEYSYNYFKDRSTLYPEYANYVSYGNYNKWVAALVDDAVFPRNVENNSIHATGFVRRLGEWDNNFVSRLKKITSPQIYDYVIIFGGINDFIGNVPMGGESETDIETYFKPAVDDFFSYLTSNFYNARIIVFTPLRTSNVYPNQVGQKQQDYSDYIKSVTKQYAIPTFDLTTSGGFMPFVPNFCRQWTFHGINGEYADGDGVHPNRDYCYNVLAKKLKNYLLSV